MKPEANCNFEQQVLLALLGCRSVAEGGARLPAMLHQVKWKELIAATSPDLYPYLSSRLEPYMEYIESPPEWELLRTARRLTAVNNLRLRHELIRVIGALKEAGIPVLALKGIVLAYTAYSDPSLRPMSDLDVLVPEGHVAEAVLVLRKLGFHYPDRAIVRRDDCSRLGPEEELAPALQLGISGVLLEVHSQLECSEPALAVPLQEFWSRSTSVVLRGHSVQTLCPEDCLFHLCLHQARHHRFEKGLLPLLDIKVFLESCQDLDWDGIAAQSLRCGCATWMYLTLEAARNLVGAAVPSIFLEALPQPRDLPKLRTLVEEQILSAGLGPPPMIPALLAEHSWRRRARMLFTRTKLVGGEEIARLRNVSGFLQLVQAYCRRLLYTITVKIPKYFRAWRSGRLSVGAVRRSACLLRHSDTLFQLVELESGFGDDRNLAGRTALEESDRDLKTTKELG